MTLEWTGERFLPWIREQSTIAYEHLHRYAYATTLVRDKRVLDLACGEGYGSKMLARAASYVVAVDIDENVIRHASTKYGGGNLQFLPGSIDAVPLPDDHSFDVIICFEAIEHIENQDAFLGEVQRLLKRGGVFMVSTPNKAVYHDESRDENPFHVSELYFDEFQALLAGRFGNVQFLGQRIHPCSSIWPIGTATSSGFREFVVERDANSDFESIDRTKRVPLYFIAVASDAAAALPLPGSVFIDQSDRLLEEKDQATQWRAEQVAERDKTIESLEDAMQWRQGQIQELSAQVEELSKGLEWSETRANELEKSVSSLEKSISSQEEALRWREHQVNELATARDYWQRESTSLTTQLQGTQRQLAAASDTLAGIYASRGWKFILKLRRLRDSLKGRGKSRG